MSIVSSFDNESKSIIDLDDIFKAPNHIADASAPATECEARGDWLQEVYDHCICRTGGFAHAQSGDCEQVRRV